MSALLALACTDDVTNDPGSLTVLLDPEDVIIEGLAPGDGNENVWDGWTVEFDKYLVTVGHVDLRFSTDDDLETDDSHLYVVDLTRVPSNGSELWAFDELRPGRWEFRYETSGAAHGAEQHETVMDDDFERMVDKDSTYLVEGSITKLDGQSCPPVALASPPAATEVVGENAVGNPCYEAEEVRFTFAARAETLFGPCEIDGVPGVSVPSGGQQTSSITIHGDHLFFNGFPSGSEGGIRRLAQWWADADLDLDGLVTEDELKAISPADLLGEEYSFGGSPIQPLEDMYTYVIAQLKTQGHYQGEGECLVDGEELEHAHDDDAHDVDAHSDEHDVDAHSDEHDAGDYEDDAG